MQLLLFATASKHNLKRGSKSSTVVATKDALVRTDVDLKGDRRIVSIVTRTGPSLLKLLPCTIEPHPLIACRPNASEAAAFSECQHRG